MVEALIGGWIEMNEESRKQARRAAGRRGMATIRILRNEGDGRIKMIVCRHCENEMPIPVNWLRNYGNSDRKRLVCENCGTPHITARFAESEDGITDDREPIEDDYSEDS